MPLTLPDLQTDAGTVARLVIVESQSPAAGDYDADEVRRGMFLMKAVVVNRLNHNPGQFGAGGAENLRDIITAPNQFKGFTADDDGKVVLDDALAQIVEDRLDKANTGAPGKYFTFIQNALDAANEPQPVVDDFATLQEIDGQAVTGGTYGWRTAGSSDPGGRFIAIPDSLGGVVAGNQFYTLTSP